jgi:HAD superfamily hydrolase (TIGR01549 family)
VIACPYVKGAVECLEDLSGRYPLYVASATPLDELRIILEARDLLKYFRDIYGVPLAKKDIFAAICRREKILPAELLFIGDSLEDQRSAEEAGTGFCAIDNGYFKGDSARKVHDLSQIHAMLGGE